MAILDANVNVRALILPFFLGNYANLAKTQQNKFGDASSTWGPRRIKNALLKKGVREVDAEKAVKLVFEDGERGSRSGLSKASIDHLFVKASKQWLKGRDVPPENRKCRVVRWLQYRGFNWDIVSSILKRLELEYSGPHSL